MADIVTLAEVKAALNIATADTTHDTELDFYIDAVTAHVEDRFGEVPSGTHTEIGQTVDLGDGTARLATFHRPVLTVTSITDDDDTEYTTGFTITADGYVEHDNLTLDRWVIVYTAGFAATPANLKLAALEDIRGLFQPGQIGPPVAFGAFGIESTDTGTTYRPVRMWPRVDAWIESRNVLGLA